MHKRFAITILIVITVLQFICKSVFAEKIDNEFNDAKAIVNQHQNDAVNALSSFQPDKSLPNYTSNPSQTKYYDIEKNGNSTLTSEAKKEANNDPTAKQINENFYNRPQYIIDFNSPSMQNSTYINQHALDILHGTDAACQHKTECTVSYVNESCQEEPTYRPHQCHQTLIVDVNKTTKEIHHQVSYRLITDKKYYLGAKLNLVTGAREVHPSDGHAYIYSFVPKGLNCSQVEVRTQKISFNGNSTQVDGGSLVPTCGSGFMVDVHLTNDNHHQNILTDVVLDVVEKITTSTVEDKWIDDCENYEKNTYCRLDKDTCLVADTTKVINDIPVTRSCWEKEKEYSCSANPTIPQSCAPLRGKGCEQTDSVCVQSVEGICMLYQQTFRCPINQCHDVSLNCPSEPLFCDGGNCVEHTLQADPDFGQSAAQLSAAVDAGKTLENEIVFKGTAESCDDSILGFANCCRDDGWGVDNHLASCTEPEKKLGLHKEQGLSVQVGGHYCSHDVMGVCTEYRKTYCSFPSKLSRIVQVEGRKQLNIGWGDPENPNCRGLTPDELQGIDFGKIDFSEVATEMTDDISLESNEDIQKRINAEIQGQVNK